MLTNSSIDFIKTKYSDQKDIDFMSKKCTETYNKLILPVIEAHSYNKEAFHLLVDMVIAHIRAHSVESISRMISPKAFEDMCETLDFVLKNEIDNIG